VIILVGWRRGRDRGQQLPLFTLQTENENVTDAWLVARRVTDIHSTMSFEFQHQKVIHFCDNSRSNHNHPTLKSGMPLQNGFISPLWMTWLVGATNFDRRPISEEIEGWEGGVKAHKELFQEGR
jgi:hypothetical protein